MYGNVADWCNDIFAADYYKSSPAADPKGPKTGKERVLRGGSWNEPEEFFSSAMRAMAAGTTMRCARKASP